MLLRVAVLILLYASKIQTPAGFLSKVCRPLPSDRQHINQSVEGLR